MSDDENDWKWIDGYKNMFRIYKDGRVESVRRKWVPNNRFMNQGIRNGYRYVQLSKDSKNKNFQIHRLIAIAFIDNPNPDKFDFVDHWNRDRLDNSIKNLRWVSSSGNNRNRKSTGSSKYLGVSFHKQRNKWNARISIDGKSKYLGLFENEEEAHKVYMEKYEEVMEEFEKI